MIIVRTEKQISHVGRKSWLHHDLNFKLTCGVPVILMHSLWSSFSVKSLDTMSSGLMRKRISSWTSPVPNTPPPIYLQAKSTCPTQHYDKDLCSSVILMNWLIYSELAPCSFKFYIRNPFPFSWNLIDWPVFYCSSAGKKIWNWS